MIGCKKDALKILEIKQEGKKRMNLNEFWRGSANSGECLPDFFLSLPTILLHKLVSR